MYCVFRELFCPDGSALIEYLSVDSQQRAYWTGFASNITLFNDFENANRYCQAMNYCYGYDLCRVTFGPGIVPDFDG